MGLRLCLVTPFAWSRPHDVNEHVAGVAAELRRLGHEVTVLAPSTRAADLIASRRALPDGGAQRERLLGRIDALVAPSEHTAEAASERLPGDYRVVTPGVDLELFRPRS